jgi:hypothetical protein
MQKVGGGMLMGGGGGSPVDWSLVRDELRERRESNFARISDVT